jgi:mono/diheme cytochrome c family protein
MVRARMSALPLAFIGTWILLGVLLFLAAMYGGPGGARERLLHSQSRRGRRVTMGVILAVWIVMGVVTPALVVAENRRDEQVGAARVKLTPSQERGRELFGQHCQQCHTLRAAGAIGQVGPDLDRLRPSEDVVLDAIENGRARGQGRMPADLVQGQDARDVASFVAAVAGKQ